MRILLIVYDNDSYIHWFPQGIAYLAGTLLQHGYDVTIYQQDVNHYPESHLTSYLNHNRFDVVGLSFIGGYYQYRKALKISEAINCSQNRPFYIIGGHGPAPEPDFFLQKTRADVVVIGEGEQTIIDLLEAIGNHRSLSHVKGIAFQDGQRTVINERRPLIDDIDMIPMPAYHLFPIAYYRLLRMPHCANTDFVLPMLSGRGCPFHCNFCYRMDEGIRERSSEAIIEEIRYLHDTYGITYIAFGDELLMSSQQRVEDLCHALMKTTFKIKWDCNGRLNYATPDILKLMEMAGCVFINYGIEAMDDRILKNMNKALTTKQISHGIEATLAAGISPGLNIIFGNIGENRETLQKGVDFLLKYDDGAQLRTIRPVTPYPGSPLYDYAIAQGLLKDVEDFYENKHINSDLLAINFTELSDEDFYTALTEANLRLINNYHQNKLQGIRRQVEQLYLQKDPNFRGFRQI